MKPPNENGVYEPELIEELARRGRSYVSVEIAQCRRLNIKGAQIYGME